jgi:hypothetical protein
MRFVLWINYLRRSLSVFYRFISVLCVFYAFYPFIKRFLVCPQGPVDFVALNSRCIYFFLYCYHAFN